MASNIWNKDIPVEKSSYLCDDEITYFNLDKFKLLLYNVRENSQSVNIYFIILILPHRRCLWEQNFSLSITILISAK